MVFFPQAELHIKRDGVGNTFANRFDLRFPGGRNIVTDIFEVATTVVAFDGKNFGENSFEADGLPLTGSRVHL